MGVKRSTAKTQLLLLEGQDLTVWRAIASGELANFQGDYLNIQDGKLLGSPVAYDGKPAYSADSPSMPRIESYSFGAASH